MKYKITIFVFLGIIFLYFLHFVITYDRTKKETFVDEDDIEHYEEPTTIQPPSKPVSTSTTYDMRILILDDIEKLNLTDKTLKGQLMQEIFADETSLKTMDSKTAEERMTFVKSKLDALKSKDSFVNSTTVASVASDSTATNPVTVTTPTTVAPTPVKTDNKDVLLKAEEALAHLQRVEANLKQIQVAFETKPTTTTTANAAETNIPANLPPVKSTFTEPTLPPPSLIEGFENITNYASFV